jgi:hypothetical protein
MGHAIVQRMFAEIGTPTVTGVVWFDEGALKVVCLAMWSLL